MPDVYVFPGGPLEPEDYGPTRWEAHLDLDGERIEKELGGRGFRAEAVLPYCVAAVRETFEEAGVWLARKNGAGDHRLEALQKQRNNEALSSGWLLHTVRKQGWVLKLSGLRRWSHWITPMGLPFRFDTRFYLARMPEDQFCLPDMKETVAGMWVTPKEALQGAWNGDMPLSPPILVTLRELLAFGSFDELMEAADARMWGERLMPRLLTLARGSLILEPWDPQYHWEQPQLTPPGESDVLPPGTTFSRVWHEGGIWRPVRIT